MLMQLVVGLALLAGLWMVFRFAMGLRWAKALREQARAAEERRGRKVVAELPRGEAVELFLEDGRGFHWGEVTVDRAEVAAACLLLNGGVIAECARPGSAPPGRPTPEEFEGRERWEVVLYLHDGRRVTVPCGTAREGVSREAAGHVFGAVRAAMEAP